jgi:hypothetical protein
MSEPYRERLNIEVNMNKKQLGDAIVSFAIQNSFVLNPLLGYEYFLKNYMKYHECSCATERKHCPCPESIKEVNEHGKCKCGLYFKNYDCWLKYDPTNPEKSLFI